MPRKTFVEHISALVKDCHIDHISSFSTAEDGEFTFVYRCPVSKDYIELTASLSESADYPSTHSYFLFASADAPSSLVKHLEKLPSWRGKTVAEFLAAVSDFFSRKAHAVVQGEVDSDDDFDMQDSAARSNDSDAGFVVRDDWEASSEAAPRGAQLSEQVSPFVSDLHAAKQAGFKIGVLGPLNDFHVSISCRIAKLALSTEAMKAWGVIPTQYLILLLRYPQGYRSLHELLSTVTSGISKHSLVEMRVGLGPSYRPSTIAEAHRAFNVLQGQELHHEQEPNMGFNDCLISGPLNTLLRERFIHILSYRMYHGLSWQGAELFYNDSQGSDTQNDSSHPKYSVKESVPPSLPKLVTDDAFQHLGADSSISFPLSAMQFVLRHFVRCTEFCLVCHCKLVTHIEALKPYVCDKPLCLYQYMALGFGPGIEHEIMTQPNVVDLLTTFCYLRARSGKLQDFPIGLALRVPCMRLEDTCIPPPGIRLPGSSQTTRGGGRQNPRGIEALTMLPSRSCHALLKAEMGTLELLLEPGPEYNAFHLLRRGEWLLLSRLMNPEQPYWTCQVLETYQFPVVRVSQIYGSKRSTGGRSNEEAVGGHMKHVQNVLGLQVKCCRYDKNFDMLSDCHRRFAICTLLDMLPRVSELRFWLSRRPGSLLSSWTERIPPSSLAVLRRIIASNRSCIVQVDKPHHALSHSCNFLEEERVTGVQGFMQFRFATGAPDKEQRFQNAVTDVSRRLQLKYPTRFAWHGSPIENWHSIIREGLNFNEAAHGRSHGDGVYNSPDFGTSINFATGILSRGNERLSNSWPQTELNILSALALNEIINAPQEYVSHSPHFVISQPDWLQTRYLFVQIAPALQQQDVALRNPMSLDPWLPPTGPFLQKLGIPLSAVPSARRKCPTDLEESIHTPISTTMESEPAPRMPEGNEDDADSISTLEEDVSILKGPQLPSNSDALSVIDTKFTVQTHLTPFRVSDFDISTLPLLPAPSYATPTATWRLQKDLRNLLKIQENHVNNGGIAQLGWYIDAEHLSRSNNLYQWLFAFHSFDKTLPLAQDMIAANISAIVFEVRFHATYPMSPPFLRVIRPRFLPFSMGGGGHVTGGGSICLDLLTDSSWTPAYDFAAVLLQVRLAIENLEPQPARLESVSALRGRPGNSLQNSYSAAEAIEAYRRVCRQHGWAIPQSLDEMALMGS